MTATRDPSGTTSRARRAVRRVAVELIPPAVGAGVTAATQLIVGGAPSLLIAAGYGAVLGGGYSLWRALAGWLGPWTAFAAVSVLSALTTAVPGAVAALFGGICPDCETAPTLGLLILLGLSLPMLVATLVGPVVFIGRRLPAWVRWARDQAGV